MTSCLSIGNPRNYEKNVIVGDLHCANKINSDLEKEISIIKAKYLKDGYLFTGRLWIY